MQPGGWALSDRAETWKEFVMTDDRKLEEQAIEELLGTRQQLTEWLQKISAAGRDVPGSVREKVRADYEGRLAEVVFSLRSHSETLTSTVDTLRASLDDQNRIREQEEETIAEVELRFHVGEYDEAEWTSRREASRKTLEDALEAISQLTADITRFEEVLGQIHEDVASEASVVTEPEASLSVEERAEEATWASEAVHAVEQEDRESEPVALHRDEPVAHHVPAPEPVEAPRFIPKGEPVSPRPERVGAGSSPRVSAGASGDDLAFLKAMTIDPSRSTAAPRAGDRAERVGSGTAAKSLKCGECSAMNRPTEWYCERCGAELAAL